VKQQPVGAARTQLPQGGLFHVKHRRWHSRAGRRAGQSLGRTAPASRSVRTERQRRLRGAGRNDSQ